MTYNPSQVHGARQFIREQRSEFLEQLTKRLRELNNPLSELTTREITAAVNPMLDAACGIQHHSLLVRARAIGLGGTRAYQRIPPEASMEAATELFQIVSDTLLNSKTPPVKPQHAAVVLQDLHSAILQRVVGAALPYASELLREINVAHHHERQRMARDLHDRLAHAIAISLQQLELHEWAEERSDADESRRRLGLLRTGLLDASEMIRQTAMELGSTHTSNGFANAVLGFIDLHGTERVTVTITDADHLDELVDSWSLEEFFLAVREAIRNSLVHSGASSIIVDVGQFDEKQLRATIQDNGSGMDQREQAQQSSGKGLASLRERIHILGGEAVIKSKPDEGTFVDLRIPV